MKFKKLFMVTCLLCSLLFVQGTALAATVHGTVYEWYSFEPLNNVVIEVNSTPEQYFVAVDAVYSFNLPPGNYRITASYFEGNTVVYAAEETVTISEDGDYVVDLLLFPAYEEELLNQSKFENFDQDFEEAEITSEEYSGYAVYAAMLLLICILLFAGYFWNKRNKKPPETLLPPEGNNGTDIKHSKSPDSFPDNSGSDNSGNSEESEMPEESERSEEDKGNHEASLERGSGSSSLKAAYPSGVKVAASPALQATEEYHTLKHDLEEVSETRAVSSGEGISGNKSQELTLGLETAAEKVPGEPELMVPSSVLNSMEEAGSGFPESLDDIETLEEAESEVREDPAACLPEDLQEVLELVRANGNRITQLELRKKSRYSESKVSLMLSDLEERGLIEKFKKGRGNIIRIPDEYILKKDVNNG